MRLFTFLYFEKGMKLSIYVAVEEAFRRDKVNCAVTHFMQNIPETPFLHGHTFSGRDHVTTQGCFLTHYKLPYDPGDTKY